MMYDDVVFAVRFRYPLNMFGSQVSIGLSRLIHAQYGILNRYCRNHRRIRPNFLSFLWLYAVEFYRQPCSHNKIYDNIVCADRFRYQLTMFVVCELIWLSRLLYTHIAYEKLYKNQQW